MAELNKLIIWGASGHAKVVADIVRLAGRYEIVAFLDDSAPPPSANEFLDLPLLKDIDQLRELRQQGVVNILLAFGHCGARLRLSTLARQEGFTLVSAIHPRAVVAKDVSIGLGSVIVGGAVINPGSSIGESVIINTCASVDHDCLIEDGVHIGPGAHIGGQVQIGQAAWIGIAAAVKDRIKIGARAIVGAGAVVLDDVPENTVVYGVPAKVIRSVKSNEN